MKRLDVLLIVAAITECCDCCVTSRELPLRFLKAAEKAGMVEKTEQVLVVDGDGFACEPERFRDGWKLTDKGKSYIKEHAPSSYEYYFGKKAMESHPPDDFICEGCGETAGEWGHFITEDCLQGPEDSRSQMIGEFECNNCGSQSWVELNQKEGAGDE